MKIKIAPRADKELSKIDSVTAKRITNAIRELANFPNTRNIRSLKGAYENMYRLRVGNYRVLFEADAEIIIVRIQNRRDVYK